MNQKLAFGFIIASLLFSSCSKPQEEDVDIPQGDTVQAVRFLSHYLPQPLPEYALYKKDPVIQGIYVTSNRAGSDAYMPDLIQFCRESGVNAMVIDVKTDDGLITFHGIETADELGLSVKNIPDIHVLLETLNQNNIFPIARVVAFKDNAAWEKRPELYIKNQDGSIWRDSSRQKSGWMNPYNKDSWEYILGIAKSAAEIGFKEIQFDYIRFDTSSRLKDADFGDTQNKSRVDIISEFTQYAVDTLKPYGVYVSADVYGTVIDSKVDADIVGQDYVAMSKVLDIICPMVYPSHYANQSMGIEIPDLQPYDTIYGAMELSNQQLSQIPKGEHRAVVRPWLQDFTASYLPKYLTYTGKERGEQIKAVYDSGQEQWLLWDAGVKYDPEGIFPKGATAKEQQAQAGS